MDPVLVLSQACLDAFGSAQTGYSSPGHICCDLDLCDKDVTCACHNFVRSAISSQRRLERDLLEGGYAVAMMRFDYGIIVDPHINEDVKSIMGTVVHNARGCPAVVALNAPVIRHVIFAHSQGSLADRVRVATYLVRLVSDGISRIGLEKRLLAYAVSILSSLVAQYRDVQADSCDDTGDDLNQHASHHRETR